ncbi:MAG: aquaporin [Elusimicrobia bacterium]|nr:aquaporin [Elusimicrobiota bacterium]
MSGNFKSYAAETIGTFALIFIGAGSVCMDVITGGKVGITGIAFAHGLTIMAMAYTYGAVSGGHFNPAVTAAMLVGKRIDGITGLFYVISQLLGAALAGLALRAILHNHPQLATGAPFLGACDLNGVGFRAGTFVEAIATFFLVSTIYATAVDKRGAAATAPIAIGMTITMCIFATGPLTGAALNPARAFGPAVATGHWANAFVYWIGPIAGGVAAALLQENLFLEKK